MITTKNNQFCALLPRLQKWLKTIESENTWQFQDPPAPFDGRHKCMVPNENQNDNER